MALVRFSLLRIILRNAYKLSMTLSEYRDREKLTLAALAERVGMPLTTVHGYVTGKRQPEPDKCLQISRSTNGAVTPADLRPDLAEIFASERLS